MRRTWLDEDLGRRTPDHHQAVDLLFVLEPVDVFADRLQHLALGDLAHHVVRVDVLHVRAIECGLHRSDFAERLGDGLDVLRALQYTGANSRDVGVIRERVPCAPDDVFELGERDEVLDQGRASIGALAESDGVHLGERADRGTKSALGEFDARDQGGGNGAKPDGQNA